MNCDATSFRPWQTEPRTGGTKAWSIRLVLLALAAHLPWAAAQETTEESPPAVDWSAWACEYCQFQTGWSSELTLGLGHVSEDSYKFGEYNGLNEEGGFLIFDADSAYRGEDATYLDISIRDLGLDSRSLSIAGGRQGSYDLYFGYDEIPHYISDSASSPYLGSGGEVLSLPAGWVDAGSTAGMTALTPSLRSVDLKTERERVSGGFKITTDSPWSYRVDLRSEDRSGSKPGGGSFFFRSAQLVEPVDYVTDQVEATISYAKKGWQASLGYYVSIFSNADESLTWDNPYTPIVAGADAGQLALPPDNEFQQISLSLAYRFNDRNHVSADYAVGHMEQNERLLQATVNPLLVVPPLPSDSANAEIDTVNARVKFVSLPTDDLRISAALGRDERDNKTPQFMYDWVTTDAFLATQRINLPYSYTRDSLRLKADFDYTRGVRFGVGYDKDDRERTFQEVDETTEDTLWGTIRLRNIDRAFVELRLSRSQRDASTYEVVAAIDPPQNLLMRKYNLADREREAVAVQLGFMPHPDYSVGFAVDFARDDYDKSTLGLADSKEHSVNVDVAAILSESTRVSAFLGRQRISSSQAGSQAFATPDWFADIDDTFDFFGFGVNYALVEDSLDIGVDLSRALSRGEIELNSGGLTQSFPDLATELDTIKLYLNYRLGEDLSLGIAYWHETYDSSDWTLDGVDPDTVANLLALGEDSPSYSNDVVKLSLSYRF